MKKYLNLRSSLTLGLLFAFLGNLIGPIPAQAQVFFLPAPGTMVPLSPEFNPPILKGIKVHPDNPFKFDFILDKGNENVIPAKAGIQKLIKYFLASLTIPEKDLWVNLSPYEKNRIIAPSFGFTEMGRDLLAEDYMLKQITASLIYPENETGRKFWKRIYDEAARRFGTTDIPVNTFNKVWIIPDKAVVYENAKAGTAYVVEAKLKVMLEEDYLSLTKHQVLEKVSDTFSNVNQLGSGIIREIIIPELTKEVNEGKNFAQLRQVYNSLILATWYKNKIKDSILTQIYEDKSKIKGTKFTNNYDVELIYQRYLQAFKKGVYNYIKEEPDPFTRQPVPRKYFSGGLIFGRLNAAMSTIHSDTGIHDDHAMQVKVRIAGLPSSEALRIVRTNMKGRHYDKFDHRGERTDGAGHFLSYVSSLDFVRRLVIDNILSSLQKPVSGQHILSIGEGQGHLAKELQAMGVRVTGIDNSEHNTRIAVANQVNQVLASAYGIPFADDSFDGIVINETIGALSLEALKESYRVLKPDGKIIITTLLNIPPEERRGISRRTKFLHYGNDEIEEGLKDAGFESVQFKEIHAPVSIVHEYALNVSGLMNFITAHKPDRAMLGAIRAITTFFPYTRDTFDVWRKRILDHWDNRKFKLLQWLQWIHLTFMPKEKYTSDPYFDKYDRNFQKMTEEEARVFLSEILISHIKYHSMPYTLRALTQRRDNKPPTVFYQETRDLLQGYHLLTAMALTHTSRPQAEATEFYFVNGVYVGYGVAAFMETPQLALQFHIFENPTDSRLGRGKVPKLSERIFRQRLRLYTKLIPEGEMRTAYVLPGQYREVQIPTFYLKLGFLPVNGFDYKDGLYLEMFGHASSAMTTEKNNPVDKTLLWKRSRDIIRKYNDLRGIFKVVDMNGGPGDFAKMLKARDSNIAVLGYETNKFLEDIDDPEGQVRWDPGDTWLDSDSVDRVTINMPYPPLVPVEIPRFVKEALRILKPGGEIYITYEAPRPFEPPADYRKAVVSGDAIITRSLSNEGFIFEGKRPLNEYAPDYPKTETIRNFEKVSGVYLFKARKPRRAMASVKKLRYVAGFFQGVMMSPFRGPRGNVLAAMKRLKKISVFWQEAGDNGVYFVPERVRDPGDFQNIFKKGQKVLQVHVDGIDPDEIKALIIRSLSALQLRHMEQAGYSGLYLNTGNRKLRELYLNSLQGAVEIQSPQSAKIKNLLSGKYHEIFYGYPSSGLPMRVVFAINQIRWDTAGPDNSQSRAMATLAMKLFSEGDLQDYYQEFFPLENKIMNFDHFKYDLFFASAIARKRIRRALYEGSGVDLTHAILTLNADENDMLDWNVRSFSSFISYVKKHWDGDERQDTYINNKRIYGYGWHSSIVGYFNACLVAELKSIGVSKEEAIKNTKPIQNGFSISFEKKFPGESQPRHYTFNFIKNSVEKFKPQRKYDVVFQRAGFSSREMFPFAQLIENISSLMKDDSFVLVNPYDFGWDNEIDEEQDLRELMQKHHFEPLELNQLQSELEEQLIRDYKIEDTVRLGFGIRIRAFYLAANTTPAPATSIHLVKAVLLKLTHLVRLSHRKQAMTSAIMEQKRGGIDFTRVGVQHEGSGIKFHLDPAALAQMQNTSGFEPQIDSIEPMTDVKSFLETAATS